MASLGHVSAGLCLAGVLAALVGVAHIVGDINSLRDEVPRPVVPFNESPSRWRVAWMNLS